jgi:hypothetical protein
VFAVKDKGKCGSCGVRAKIELEVEVEAKGEGDESDIFIDLLCIEKRHTFLICGQMV